MSAERESGEEEFKQYASFEEQIKYIVAPESKGKRIDQSLLLGRTPKIWRDIGLSDVPVMMSVSHTRENYFPRSEQYPEGKGMGKKLYQLPEKIQDPIAIFASKTHPRDSVVALIELKDKNGKPVVTPIEINGLSQNSGYLIDVNRIKTAFGKENAWKLLRDAINDEILDGNTLFYWQKNKAMSLAHAAGVQFPRNVPNIDGFVHSISENKDLVNTKVLQQTETKQFKNNESIETLLDRRRQLPKTMASDASNKVIKQYEKSVNHQISPTEKVKMKADRETYETARELLLQAASDEELKKSEIYSPLLREYVRVLRKSFPNSGKVGMAEQGNIFVAETAGKGGRPFKAKAFVKCKVGSDLFVVRRKGNQLFARSAVINGVIVPIFQHLGVFRAEEGKDILYKL